MKITIQPGDYTFDASAQTVTFANYNPVILENIKLIVNLVTNDIIYLFAKNPINGTVATDTLTLAFDTTAMSDTDELMIVYDDPDYVTPVSVGSLPLPTGGATEATLLEIEANTDGLETVLGTIDTDTGNISTKIDTLAGAVSGTEMQVDVLTMPTVTVQATDLDIRNLLFASDKVDVTGSDITVNAGTDLNTSALNLEATQVDVKTAVEAIAATASGTELQVDIVSAPTLTVQAINLDVRDLTFAADKVDASGSTVTANAGTDLNTSALNLEATQADIKTAVQLLDDAVYTDGAGAVTKGIAILGQDGTNPQAIRTDANGELQVDVITMPSLTVTSITNPVTITGQANDGAPVAGAPVRVAGKDGSGNTQDILTDTSGRLTPLVGFISTSNSRANANLGGATTFNGTFEDITQYVGFSLGILDAGANGGTLTINWSEDGVNVRDTDVVVVPTANGQQYNWGRKWQYFQVSYLHGAGAGNVVIQTILHTTEVPASTHFGSDTLTTGQDGPLVHAVLWGNNGSSLLKIQTDSSGRVITSSEQSSTGTLTNVNDTASNTTLLAANTSRKGATIINDSTSILYVKCGTTASSTSFTAKLYTDDYWEVPFGYTGVLEGIWSSDASGAARITEFT